MNDPAEREVIGVGAGVQALYRLARKTRRRRGADDFEEEGGYEAFASQQSPPAPSQRAKQNQDVQVRLTARNSHFSGGFLQS
ncbi:hypothetical protein ACVIN2_002435 [Bradyrhizobium sp. USDA 3650]